MLDPIVNSQTVLCPRRSRRHFISTLIGWMGSVPKGTILSSSSKTEAHSNVGITRLCSDSSSSLRQLCIVWSTKKSCECWLTTTNLKQDGFDRGQIKHHADIYIYDFMSEATNRTTLPRAHPQRIVTISRAAMYNVAIIMGRIAFFTHGKLSKVSCWHVRTAAIAYSL